MLALAESAEQRVRRRAQDAAPLRIGYVSWLPDAPEALLAPVRLRTDDWVLPSHLQVERVAQGTLDLAVAWVPADQAAALGVVPHLLRVESLPALAPGSGTAGPVPAGDTTVLLDADERAWSSWNRFAAEFARATGAGTAAVEDGGITGEAFHAHVRELGVPLLTSPKRHLGATPPGLVHREVVRPVPLWTWSLVHRANDDRPAVHQAVKALLAYGHSRQWDRSPRDERWWAPDDDPHRDSLTPAC
jgi:hypothetical protein